MASKEPPRELSFKDRAQHRHLFLGRIRRDSHTGMVSLDLIQQHEVVEMSDGAEYVTVLLKVDPHIPMKFNRGT
jgi:hypothetical protein